MKKAFKTTFAHVFFSVVVMLAFSGSSRAGDYFVAFDNGGIGYDWGYCISGPGQCGASDGQSFTLYNPFTLTSQTHMVGFQNWNGQGSADSYIQTNWSIWLQEPQLSQSPTYSGSSVAQIHPDSGFNLATVTGLDINLAPGSYWLGLSHETTEPWTYVVPSKWVSGAIFSDGEMLFPEHGQMAFQILATVPEPGSMALFAIGLPAILLRLRAKRGQSLNS